MNISMSSDIQQKTSTPEKSSFNERMIDPSIVKLSSEEKARMRYELEEDDTPILLYPFKMFWKLYDFFFKIFETIVIKLEDLSLWKTIIDTIQFIFKYPILSFPFAAVIATAAVPFFGFVAFCIATSVATFIGFLIIEGSVLSIITIFIGGVFLFAMGIIIIIAVLFMISKYVFHKVSVKH